MSRPPMIVDGHCHLASSRCIPRDFFVGVGQNMARKKSARVRPGEAESLARLMELQYQDHDADRLVRKMDEACIARTVLLAPDFTYVFKSHYSLEDMAAQHAAVRARHPGRFHVFFGVDPRWGRSGHDIFERSVDTYGFEGLKVYPPCGFSPSDERMFPLYEICAARDLPVLLHTGPTTPTLDFRFADPYLIDAAAKQFPGVNFILAHGGVNFVEQAKLMCNYRPNVYLDISGFPAAMTATTWQQHLAELFAQGINHKIIFGTDWPVFSMKDDLSAMVSHLLEDGGPMHGLPDAVVADIMAGTIDKLLPNPPKAEGSAGAAAALSLEGESP
ncbi:amidohydrolase family protein [Luteibacter sp. 9135]|uniref:amidohydrolase family protein n=1 Tax=Luteibacter sp. 9135 TaxID=1500893 RepID=UPI0009DD5C6D|nr:amidohydrolase family protein [Luteibacter sp. 9135]